VTSVERLIWHRHCQCTTAS